MNPHPRSHRRPSAFTLVELLTVIVIIAILMGLLFPLMGVIKDNANKAAAKTACQSIVTAVKAYNTEYGKYPNPLAASSTATTDAIVGETAGGATVGNENLFFTLRAKASGTNASHALNPRRIVFFEGPDAANASSPKKGFGTTGAFFDPWGTQYCVAIDMSYDNHLDTLTYVDFKYTTGTDNKAPQTGCGAYSLGKDGKLGTADDKKYKSSGTASDDVISWQ